jgi:aminoglycoside 3-N-acetyltransferase
MITYRDLVTSFRALGLERNTPLIVHASLSAFDPVNGGVDTVLGALMAVFEPLLMPVFTTRTLIIPEAGPPDNGITYGSGRLSNAAAEFFRPDLPADRAMGVLAESLRRLPQAQRSAHPALSFVGVNCAVLLDSQTLAEPLEPLSLLLKAGGWVVLMGVDHTANVSLHLAEKQAGRKQFVRWALTPAGVVECPNMPGCSQGFNTIEPRLRRVSRLVQAGETVIQAVPLADLVNSARSWLEVDPLALLCDRPDCGPCQAIRAQVIRV